MCETKCFICQSTCVRFCPFESIKRDGLTSASRPQFSNRIGRRRLISGTVWGGRLLISFRAWSEGACMKWWLRMEMRLQPGNPQNRRSYITRCFGFGLGHFASDEASKELFSSAASALAASICRRTGSANRGQSITCPPDCSTVLGNEGLHFALLYQLIKSAVMRKG